MLRVAVLLATTLLIAGCVSSQEMQLSKNTVRINTHGEGFIGSVESDNFTMRRAAKLTLDNGYQRFIIADASRSSRVETVGYTPGQAITNVRYEGHRRVETTSYTAPQPIRETMTEVGVTVIMLNPGDEDFENAIDAAETIKRLSN
jgi:outer membrane murein-binding lipoprotein Lpp